MNERAPACLPRILRGVEVAARVGLSLTTIYRLERVGRFPRRVRLSDSVVGWLEPEVEAWFRERVEKRPN